MLVVALVCLACAPGSRAATVLVGPGGNLQAALNAAQPGDVIQLQAGARFVGNFVLPARPGGDVYITVRSSAPDADFPSTPARITPDHSASLPKLQSPNGQPALKTAAGAHHWRVALVEFLGNQGGSGEIIALGDGSAAQSRAEAVPHDLIIDRCYIHGDPDTGQKRGISLNSSATSVTNSWISDIKATGQDSQAIAGWNGPGPFLITNNHLEAAGQGFMLGGADAAIRGLIPAGVTFAGNHVTRPQTWRGSPWQVKNLLELKNARDVRIEGNLFENNWQGAQAGYAILFTPRNQDGGSPWSAVEDVTFRYNVVRHAAAALSILGHDSPNPSGPAARIEISDNLAYDVDGGAWGGNGDFLLIGDGPSDVTVEHNTVLHTGNVVSAYGGSVAQPTPVRGFAFTGNLMRHNAYGVHGSDRGVGNDTLSAYFPSVVFARNVLAGGPSGSYPGDNAFPSAADFDRFFADAAAGDFRLAPGAGVKKGGDGRMPGADVDAVNVRWRAAQSGTWTPSMLERQRPERDPRRKGSRPS